MDQFSMDDVKELLFKQTMNSYNTEKQLINYIKQLETKLKELEEKNKED